MTVGLMAAVLLATTACTATSERVTTGTGATAGSSTDRGTAAQHAAYGYGAKTSGVDYQPDVVVVGGGPAGIRSASANGLTWTIDSAAPGASKLQVGKVMLMTSTVAGRVVAMHDEGSSRVVTLAPVQLGDILENGKIDLRQSLGGASMLFQRVPGLDVGPTVPTADELGGFRATAPGGSGATLPPPTSIGPVIGLSPWKIKPYLDTNGKLGVGVEREKSGLKLTAELAFTTSNLTIDGKLTVSHGVPTHSSLRIDGLTGLQISFGAGVATGGDDNGKATLILPGDFKYVVPPSPATGELPLTITVKYKLSIATALTGRNSTLLGTGKYKLDGPLGFDQGKALVPKLTVQKSLIDSLSGITLGPSGVVVALNLKTQIGVGLPVFNAGPNAGVTVAFGATNGSSLGASLVRCRGASLDVDVTFGASVNVEAVLISALRKFLPPNYKLEIGTELKTKVLHRDQVVPDVPLCRG